MKRRASREIIELFKDHYANGGGRFGVASEIVAWLRSSHRIRVTVAQARKWDRQARLERADVLQSTTTPSGRNAYVRQAAPAHSERRQARAVRLKDTATRLSNDIREARADAAQPDASAIERATVTLLEQASNLVNAAIGDDDSGGSGGSGSPGPGRPGGGGDDWPDPAAVRAWARGQGIPVGDRGRMPYSLYDKYLAAHGLQSVG